MRRHARRVPRRRSVGEGGVGALLAVLWVVLAGPTPGAARPVAVPPPPPAVEARPALPVPAAVRSPPRPPAFPRTADPRCGTETAVEGLSVAIEAPLLTSDVGVAIPLVANVSGGSPPYRVGWNDSSGGWATGGLWSVNTSSAGTVDVVASASDSAGDVAESSLRLTFVPGPTLALSASSEAVDAGVPFVLRIATSGGVPPLELEWTVSSGTSNGSEQKGAAASISVSATVGVPGPVVATASVVDAAGERASVSSTVATAFAPPSIELGPDPAFADAGDPFRLEGRVVGGAPPLNWSVLPSLPVFGAGPSAGRVETNGSFTWSAGFGAPGNATLSVAVTDAVGTVVGTTLSVEVLPPLTVELLPPNGTVPVDTSVALTAVIAGGYPPYWWAINTTGTSDPRGSALSSGDLTIELTVLNASTRSVTLWVADAVGGSSVGTVGIAPTVAGPGAPTAPPTSLPPSILGGAATPAAIALTVLTLLVIVVTTWRRRTGASEHAQRLVNEQVAKGGPFSQGTLELLGQRLDIGLAAMGGVIRRLLRKQVLVASPTLDGDVELRAASTPANDGPEVRL